jgi:hypothetical protein
VIACSFGATAPNAFLEFRTNTANVSDAFSSDDRYPLIRGNVTTLSGTGAAVTLKAGS